MVLFGTIPSVSCFDAGLLCSATPEIDRYCCPYAFHPQPYGYCLQSGERRTLEEGEQEGLNVTAGSSEEEREMRLMLRPQQEFATFDEIQEFLNTECNFSQYNVSVVVRGLHLLTLYNPIVESSPTSTVPVILTAGASCPTFVLDSRFDTTDMTRSEQSHASKHMSFLSSDVAQAALEVAYPVGEATLVDIIESAYLAAMAELPGGQEDDKNDIVTRNFSIFLLNLFGELSFEVDEGGLMAAGLILLV
jgi:hypothetical protein